MKTTHQLRRVGVLGWALIFLMGWEGAQAARFLFDATKAEMAGSADWVIDADSHNLNVGSGNGSGRVMSSNSYDSNPQRYPNPLQSGVTSSTTETYWQGALSSWAVDLVQAGHQVETLPYNGKITFGDSTNAQDLSNYDVFVLVEPNILFSAAEKTALISYVKSGGGLLMVADHGHLTGGTGSDRNNDGEDSVDVLNDLMTNTVQNNPFGVSFNGNEVSGTYSYLNTSSSDPLIRGAAGTVNNIDFNNGSNITINTSQNASVTMAIWSSSSRSASTGLVAYGSYGSGRFVAFGDSSTFDDGTGDPGDILYNSYNLTSYGNSKVILNASFWLAQKPPEVTTGMATNVGTNSATVNGVVNPNGLSTTAKFLYGTTTNYGSVTNVSGTLTGTNATNVSVGLTSLVAGTTYHYALVATNAGGSAQGADQSFATLAPAPVVTTGTATNVGTNSATVSGVVNPNGLSTTAKFLYGTTTNYGSVTNVSGTLTGTNATNVSVGLTSLVAGTTYHYALVATNAGGSAQGADQSFTTWTALQAWRQQWFGTTNNSGFAADTYVASGDGLANLIKYGLGLNPLVASPSPITFSLAGGYLTMTVPRSSSATGISYFLESTDNLAGGWSTSSVVIDVNTSTLFQGHDSNPLSGTSRRFMRLKLTQP